MSIVTFYNSSIEQTGKTMSIAAIATYMAIEHNYRILVVSTTNRDDSLKRCFWEEKKKRLHAVIPHSDISYIDYWLGEAVSFIESEDGAQALSKIRAPEAINFSKMPASIELSIT